MARTAEQKTATAHASRRKGIRGERKLALILETWWGTKFRRVPRSGALRWGTDQRVAGDLVTNDPNFPFVVEVKNRENWELIHLFDGKGKIFDWWEQVRADGERVNKKPILFFTKNGLPFYAMIRMDQVPGDPKHLACWLIVKRDGCVYIIAKAEELLRQLKRPPKDLPIPEDETVQEETDRETDCEA